MQDDEPSRILGMLNEAIRVSDSDSQFCTAAYGRLELDAVGARLTVASGGHPPPLMVHEDGTVEEIGAARDAARLASRDHSSRIATWTCRRDPPWCSTPTA